jgi:hypothetical protein
VGVKKKLAIVAEILLSVCLVAAFESGQFHIGHWTSAPPPKACVYREPGFRGAFVCLTAGREFSDLSKTGFGHHVGSIEITGDGEVTAYQRAGFSGKPVILRKSVADVRTLVGRAGDEISSLKVADRDFCLHQSPNGDGMICVPREVATVASGFLKKVSRL